MTNVDELAKKIQLLDEAYRSGNPLVSDSEFDKLRAELVDIAPNHPLLLSPGGGNNLLSLVKKNLSNERKILIEQLNSNHISGALGQRFVGSCMLHTMQSAVLDINIRIDHNVGRLLNQITISNGLDLSILLIAQQARGGYSPLRTIITTTLFHVDSRRHVDHRELCHQIEHIRRCWTFSI